MRNEAMTRHLALATALLLAMGTAQAAQTRQAKQAKPPSDAQMIASAMRAAPPSVGRHATIVAMQPDGSMRTLRKGSNGFTCIPDAPATPGPDPMCADEAAMGWLHAWLTRTAPPSGKVGLMYMLEGGTDASNTDPYATKPEGKHWIKTGPHVMVVGADAAFYGQYPHLAQPDTSAPYVMWADTPYMHLMVPVR